MRQELLAKVAKAFNRAVPIVLVTTFDPREFVTQMTEYMNDFAERHHKQIPIVEWDLANGIVGLNGSSKDMIDGILSGRGWVAEMRQDGTQETDGDNPYASLSDSGSADKLAERSASEFLDYIQDLPPNGIAFFHNAHFWLRDSERDTRALVMQGVSNLRDIFKEAIGEEDEEGDPINEAQHGPRMLVLLAPDLKLPAELQHDVVTYDDPLPDREELNAIVTRFFTANHYAKKPQIIARTVDLVSGLTPFGAEQVLSLTATPKDGCDFDELRELRRRFIEGIPGLSVYRGTETFADVAGVPWIKEFLSMVLNSETPPGGIVFIDEIDKAIAGFGTETSGTTDDLVGLMLKEMDAADADGIIFNGIPGCTKSYLAKTAGCEGGIDTIAMDIGGSKGEGLLGQAEMNARQMLKASIAICSGRPYWIATCNRMSRLPAPLLRRFTDGIVFFDLPGAEEKKAIWDIQIRLRKLTAKHGIDTIPNDDGWTPAEIRNCCKRARRFGIDLSTAAKAINPASRYRADEFESIRKEASGRYLLATTGELFSNDKPRGRKAAGSRRVRPSDN